MHLQNTCILLLGMVIYKTVGIGNGLVMANLALDVLSDILTILIDGTVRIVGNCTGSDNSAPETNYWIYTNNNPNNPTVVTEPSEHMCNGPTRIILLAHGWSWDANAPYIIGLKNAYLKRYANACIISVNWGAYALQNYQSAYCAAPGVASNIANFLCNLRSVDLNATHLVGHSMGAQIFGMSGGMVQKRCATTLGRITGLDSAGPLYNGISTAKRLDASDAHFVDVIHTNEGQYGYTGSCGDLDVFANCGYFQPGCLTSVIARDIFQNISAITNLAIDYVSCNHQRSCDIFEESINSQEFVANRCFLCGFPICGPLFFPNERKIIGEDATRGDVQNYVLYTNARSPLAKG